MPRRPHLSAVRRPLPARVAGVVLCAALTCLVAGCGSDVVSVGHFAVPPAGRQDCPAFIAALPKHVSGQARRRVSGSSYAAAWGDPPIVLRCGVGRPAGFDRFSACQTADGIDWFVPDKAFEDQQADVMMTTVYRRPAVSVHLPAEYRPPVAAMVDLTRAIRQHTHAFGHCR